MSSVTHDALCSGISTVSPSGLTAKAGGTGSGCHILESNDLFFFSTPFSSSLRSSRLVDVVIVVVLLVNSVNPETFRSA